MRFMCAFVLLLSVPGCADHFHDEKDFGVGPQCPPHEPVVVDPAGVAYQYVVDSLHFARDATEAQQLGLDLDCDEQDRTDNALGQIVAFVASVGDYDLDYETKLLIDTGELLHLVQIQSPSPTDADGVGIVILHGEDLDGDVSDNFSGSEPFGIDESRGHGLLTGRIEDGHLTAEYGTAPVAVTFPGLEEPFVLHLVGARIEADPTDSGIAGRIAGGVTEEEVEGTVIPVFQEGLSRIVARDCDETGCERDSFGETLLELFDDCSRGSQTCDGRISVDELRDNDLVSSLLSPDLDLFDENGEFNPRVDEVKDSLSIGIGFTAVGASFSAP